MTGTKYIIGEKQSLILKSCCQGVVHLTLGPMTVRIDPQTFCEMAKDIGEFAKGIEQRCFQKKEEELKKTCFDFFFPKRQANETQEAAAGSLPSANKILQWTHPEHTSRPL